MDDRRALLDTLARIDRGDREAAAELLPLVYAELRRFAAARIARLPPGQTIGATALVHEAYLGLVEGGDPGFHGRAHFFGAAARAMHDVIVDRARRKSAEKRGGGKAAIDLDAISIADVDGLALEDSIALADALERLRAAHPDRADVAMMKAFGGLDEREIAELQGVSARTVERSWRFARAFLAKELAR